MSTQPDCYFLLLFNSSPSPFIASLTPFFAPLRTLTIFYRPLTSPCSPFLYLLTYRRNSQIISRTLTPLCRPSKPLFHPSAPDHCPLTPLCHLLTPPLGPLTLFSRPLTPIPRPLTRLIQPSMPV